MQLTEHASVVELADARDSKSRVREDVRVRPPPPARVRIPGFVFAAERGFGFFIYSAHPVKYKRERMTSMKELRRKRAVAARKRNRRDVMSRSKGE